MARRFYIVSYDVTDDRRRTRLAKRLRDFGDRVQYSVFCCQLNPRERVRMLAEIKPCLHRDEDQVLIVDAGPVEGQKPEPDVEYIGRVWAPEQRSQIV